MGNFKPSSVFEKSINDNDVSAIKTCLENIIALDPLFKTNDFADACNYVRNKGVIINEEYKLLPGEIFSEKTEDWTRPYFFGLTEFLRRNFAVRERLPHIKEVGRVAFKALQQHEETASSPTGGAATSDFLGAPQRHPVEQGNKLKFRLSTLVSAAVVLGIVVAVLVFIVRIAKGQ